jgi:hypothetical protein
VPVASRKSGNVFERRLIEAYIQETGKDPVTGEDLSIEDLVELKTARAVKPRPPALTSIPSLLSVFQNEWDALALETYTLKQHLSQLRQELSTALYNNDAAVRVIARLTKERDEARDALGRLSLQDRRGAAPTNGANGDAMQVDGQGLPDEIVAKVDATQQRSVRVKADEEGILKSAQIICHAPAKTSTSRLGDPRQCASHGIHESCGSSQHRQQVTRFGLYWISGFGRRSRWLTEHFLCPRIRNITDHARRWQLGQRYRGIHSWWQDPIDCR